MTKALILQRLLDEKHITAEEAIILLTADEKPPVYPYLYQPNPWNPPIWHTTSTSTAPVTKSNLPPSSREPVWGC